MTTPFDHDRNPERFRLATEVTQRYLRVGRSLYSHLAELLAGVGARRILDIGCGEGPSGRRCPSSFSREPSGAAIGSSAAAPGQAWPMSASSSATTSVPSRQLHLDSTVEQDSPDRAPPPPAIRQGHGAVSTRT